MQSALVSLVILCANLVGMQFDDSSVMRSYDMKSVLFSSGVGVSTTDSRIVSENFLWTTVSENGVYQTIWISNGVKTGELGYHPISRESFQLGFSAGAVSKRGLGFHPQGFSLGMRLEHKSGLFVQATRADGSNKGFVGLRLVAFGTVRER